MVTYVSDRRTMVYFPPFWFDLETAQLWRDDNRIALSPKAGFVLAILVARPGVLFSKHELLNLVWHGAGVQSSILKVYIRELRKALGDSAQRSRYIETLAGRGYRFIGDVVDDLADRESSAFTGRANELAVLRNALQLARSGYRRTVFVAGRPGFGKTSLCEAFLSELAQSETVIARGQCFEACAVGEAHYAVIDALTDLCRNDEEALGHVVRNAPSWLVQLPQYGRMDSELHVGSGEPSQPRLLAEMNEVIRAITKTRVLVLFLEDLQWADDATLELIAKVTRNNEPASLLTIGTFRNGATLTPSDVFVERLASLHSERSVAVLTLREFTREDVGAYLNTRFRSRAIVASLTPMLYNFTSGHPQHMVAALDQLVAAGHLRYQSGRWHVSGPLSQVYRSIQDTLQTVITRRFRQLPEQVRALLDSAAQIGTRFNARVAALVADLDVAAVEQQCDRLIVEGILERDRQEHSSDGVRSSGYRFRRTIDRTALRKQTLPAAADRLRQRIADALGTAS